jgi:hypothetical protein
LFKDWEAVGGFMSELEGQGLTRREMLRKGVITGGAALAWATPVVTTIGINRAMASTTSPVTTTTTTTVVGGLSYIAINYTCGTDPTVYYSKFDENGWSGGAGQVESQCPGIETENGVDATGVFSANLSTGAVTALTGCTLVAVGRKGGQNCTVTAS